MSLPRRRRTLAAPPTDTAQHLDAPLALAWVSGEWTGSRRQVVQGHLSQCEACRQRLSDLD